MDLEELDVESCELLFNSIEPNECAYWRQSFKLVLGGFAMTDVAGSVKADAVLEVLPDCFLQRGGFVVSDAQWLS